MDASKSGGKVHPLPLEGKGKDEDDAAEMKDHVENLAYSIAIVLKADGIEDRTAADDTAVADVKDDSSAKGETSSKTKVADGGDSFSELHRRLVHSLLAEGLAVGILDSTAETVGQIVVLVDCTSLELTGEKDKTGESDVVDSKSSLKKAHGQSLLFKEHDDAHHELLQSLIGSNSSSQRKSHSNKDTTLTPAEELYLTGRVVLRALNNINVGKDGVLYEFDSISGGDKSTPLEMIIDDVFPLHDEHFNENFMELLNKSPKCGPGFTGTMRHIWEAWIVQSRERMHADVIRCHYGDRISVYIEFLLYYRRWLWILTAMATGNYLVIRFASWEAYLITASLMGIITCAVWGPMFARNWKSHFHFISREWTESHVLFPMSQVRNPNLSRKILEMTPEERESRRTLVSIITALVVLVNICILAPISLIFTQWYVYGKMAPTCECCEFFLRSGIGNRSVGFMDVDLEEWPQSCVEEYYNEKGRYPLNFENQPEECVWWSTCFTHSAATVGTDRWVYILLQGVAMGIILDVLQTAIFKKLTAVLTAYEGHLYLEEFSKYLIRKQFFFVWVNMFYWYLTITLLYVPFGAMIQNSLVDYGWAAFVPPWGFRPGKVELDEAFVTPLVVTALLNFIIDTFMPSRLAKLTLKARVQKRQLRAKLPGDVVHFAKGFWADVISTGEKIAHKVDHGVTEIAQHAHEAAQHAQEVVAQEVAHLRAHIQPSPRGLADSSKEKKNAVEEANEAHGAESDLSHQHRRGFAVTEEEAKVMQIERLALAQSDSASAPMRLFVRVAKALHDVPNVAAKLHYYQRTPDVNSFDSGDVMMQSVLPQYNENNEYLVIVLQLGYISMFTSAWGLLPLAAAIRMIFSYRASCYQILFACKRSLPLGMLKSPGEWLQTIYITFVLAVPVVCAQFCISTGGLDAAVRRLAGRNLHCGHDDLANERMVADYSTCTNMTVLSRGTAAFVLEHLVFGLFALVYVQTDYYGHSRHLRTLTRSHTVRAREVRRKANLITLEPLAHTDISDKSGHATANNHLQLSARLSPSYIKAAESRFKVSDTDNDNRLTYHEFHNLIVAIIQENSRRAFGRQQDDEQLNDLWFAVRCLAQRREEALDKSSWEIDLDRFIETLAKASKHRLLCPLLERL